MRPELEKSPECGLPPATRLWDFLFPSNTEKRATNDPIRCELPALRGAEIAALYYDQRRAGDFYEFLRAGKSRMLFALLDMAGRRADTREILRAAQKTFRETAAQRFAREDFNETTAMMDLCHGLNRTILRGGIRACPGFLGCYNEELGTLCYASAGHTPALVHDAAGITRLEATGLPLGLFSHVRRALPHVLCSRTLRWWLSRVELLKRNAREQNSVWREQLVVFRAPPASVRMNCALRFCRRPRNLRVFP